jgi:S1-C subfamily serine protease
MSPKRWFVGLFIGLFALAAVPAAAQAEAELKKRILQKVEEKLKSEEARILKEIEKIIDEELGLKPKETPPKEDPPKEAKKAGYLGIGIAELTEDMRAELGLDAGEGVMVTQVAPGLPAEKAGLQQEDVILSIDKKKVGDSKSLIEAVSKSGAGAVIEIKILRGTDEKTLKATLVEKPAAQPERPPEPPPKKSEPQNEQSREEMRQRIRDFMKKREGGETPKEEPKTEPEPKGNIDELIGQIDQWLKSDEVQKAAAQAVEKMEGLGMDVEKYLQKGEDGVWKLTEDFHDLLKARLERFTPDQLKVEIEKHRKMLQDLFGFELPEFPATKEAPASKTGDTPGFLGIMVDELDDAARAQFDIEEGVGVVVTAVQENSPAANAGVKAHDIVLKINGAWLKGERDLAKALKRGKEGDTLEITLLSGGKEKTVKATLAAKD